MAVQGSVVGDATHHNFMWQPWLTRLNKVHQRKVVNIMLFCAVVQLAIYEFPKALYGEHSFQKLFKPPDSFQI